MNKLGICFLILGFFVLVQCTTSEINSESSDSDSDTTASFIEKHKNASYPNNIAIITGEQIGTGEKVLDSLYKELPIINEFKDNGLLIEKAIVGIEECYFYCWSGVILKIKNTTDKIMFPDIELKFMVDGEPRFLQNDVKVYGSMAVDASGKHQTALIPGEVAYAFAPFSEETYKDSFESVIITHLDINGYKEPLEGNAVLSSYKVIPLEYSFVEDSKGNEKAAIKVKLKNDSPVDLSVHFCRMFILNNEGEPIYYSFIGGKSTGQDFIIKANQEYEYFDENNSAWFTGNSTKVMFIIDYNIP